MTTLEKRNIKSCNTLKTNLLSPPLKLLKKYKTMLYTLFWGLCLFCNRSEEHTSELQSQSNLVCRLLLVKKQQIRRQAEKANSQSFDFDLADLQNLVDRGEMTQEEFRRARAVILSRTHPSLEPAKGLPVL